MSNVTSVHHESNAARHLDAGVLKVRRSATSANGPRGPSGRRLNRARVTLLVVGTASLVLIATPSASSAASVSPTETTSYFEDNANPHSLFARGSVAGRADAEGIVILDFGRPADNGITAGTLDFNGSFVSLGAVAGGVRAFVRGYYKNTPANTAIDVAIGTNNSCGTGQPCGKTICGCSNEPESFGAWGEQFASTVESTGEWASEYRSANGLTDDVRIVGADDAEPGYDPAFQNTYDLLLGFASAVGGSFPTMVDFGSADAHYWSEKELFEVAFGFPADVPMPEIYYSDQVGEWSALIRYARSRGKDLTIFGVLADKVGGCRRKPLTTRCSAPASKATGQSAIPWLSHMNR